MKLCNLYILEDAKGKGPAILKILGAAVRGIGRALLYLTAIVAHGMLKTAVAKGEVKPSDGVRGYKEAAGVKIKNIIKNSELNRADRGVLLQYAAKASAEMDKVEDRIAAIQEINPELAKQAFIAIDHLRVEWESKLPTGDKHTRATAIQVVKEYRELTARCMGVLEVSEERAKAKPEQQPEQQPEQRPEQPEQPGKPESEKSESGKPEPIGVEGPEEDVPPNLPDEL